MEYLIINNNKLHGLIPSPLTSCKSLIEVVILNNQFTSISNQFRSNSSLKQLSTQHNQLTASRQLSIDLGANSQLANLNLSETNFKCNIFILEFSQLSQNPFILSLSKNKLIGKILVDMAMHELLLWMDLSYNFFISTVPFAIANLTCLKTHHLRSNNLSMMDPSIFSNFAFMLH